MGITDKPESFLNFVKTRRSERKMWPGVIPRAELELIVECGLWAPSASNQQPWHFAVITRRALVRELAAAVGARLADVRAGIRSSSAERSFDGYTRYFTFFQDASALICVFVEPYRGLLERILTRYAPDVAANVGSNASCLSVAAACQNVLLAAHALGYPACWLTGPLIAREEFEKAAKPAGDWELASVIAVGRREPGQEPPRAVPRRDAAETVSFIE